MVSTVLRMKQSAVGLDTVALEEKSGALASEAELEAASGEDHTVESKEAGTKDSLLKDILMLVVGAVLIAVGADLLVDNATLIAQNFGVSEKVIGLTIVALGTSLPELATCIVAALKGRGQLALGNILGSNIFNIILILGGASLIRPLSYAGISIVDSVTLLLSSVMILLTAYTFKKNMIDRIEGLILLGIEIVYIWYLCM
jgi:cation:H+ antiporter